MSGEPYDMYWMLKDTVRFHTSRYPSGRLIYQDSFEGAQLYWACSSMYGGAGGDTNQIINQGYNSDHAYRLASGSVASGGYEVYRRVGRPQWPNMRIGLECFFHVALNNINTNPWAHRLHFGIEVVGGPTDAHKDIACICMDDRGDLYYNSNTSAMQGGTYFGHVDYMAGIQYCYWNHMKMVADFRNGLDTGKYVSFKINHLDFTSAVAGINTDYSTSSGETDPFNNLESFFHTLNSPSTSGGSGSLDFRLDDVIFTCDEP
jgi:hypothetical protein